MTAKIANRVEKGKKSWKIGGTSSWMIRKGKARAKEIL